MIYEKEFYKGKVFSFDDSRVVFSNFAGVPNPNSMFPSNERTVNVEIAPSMVPELEEIGINVKSWPRDPEEGQQVTYHVPLKIYFRDKYGELKPEHLQPKIYVHREDDIYNGILYTEDMIGKGENSLDKYHFKSCEGTFAPVLNNKGTISLYLRTIHLVQSVSEDPHAYKYRRPVEEEENLPY